jgi:hypothetical protein
MRLLQLQLEQACSAVGLELYIYLAQLQQRISPHARLGNVRAVLAAGGRLRHGGRGVEPRP